eukprot:1819664-Amphidinium_carterae.1
MHVCWDRLAGFAEYFWRVEAADEIEQLGEALQKACDAHAEDQQEHRMELSIDSNAGKSISHN